MFINRPLIAFLKGKEGQLLKTCLLQLFIVLMGTLVALCSAAAVRMVQGEGTALFFNALWQPFALAGAALLLEFRLIRKRAVVSEKFGLSVKLTLRKQLVAKLFELGPAYVSRERTGNLASIISGRVEFLTEYYNIYLPSAVAAIANAAVLIAVLAYLDGVTAMVCLLGCTGMLVCPMLFYFLMRERGRREMAAYADYFSDCLDSLQGMTTLKAFNSGARQREVIHQKGEQLRQAVMGQLRITTLENIVLQLFAGLGSVVSVAVAAYRAANAQIPPDALVYVLFLIGACFMPMQTLINAWHLGYRGVVAAYAIIEVLQEKTTLSLRAKKETQTSLQLKEGIRFDNVSFAYNDTDGDVLHAVSFCIQGGTTAALVGVSGCGKSTCAQLLSGFYPVRTGRIVVGGQTLSDRTVGTVQDAIAAVWQDCRLFYGTVEENIRMGNPKASMEEIIRAAQAAGIHDFIMSLPEEYHTMIGEKGMRFSGGERQRVALARAFLRDAPIVILDEATSSLDRKNERSIEQGFARISHERTALVIAHRMATIQRADRIIMLDRGRVVSQGTHAELARTSSAYRALMGIRTEGTQQDGQT